MLVPLERIEKAILVVRGQKVMMDADLAVLYGVQTKVLNQAVKRNRDRFPADFMFQLTEEEGSPLESIRSQFVTASKRNLRYLPYAFTEHGAIMAASVLNSPRAVEVSVYVVRAFVRLRELTAANRELARKLDELERRAAGHDSAIVGLFEAIRGLMGPVKKERKTIGFKVEEEGASWAS